MLHILPAIAFFYICDTLYGYEVRLLANILLIRSINKLTIK